MKKLLFLVSIFSFFSLSAWVAVEKPLYVVVTSFENAFWVKRNLDSIFFTRL